MWRHLMFCNKYLQLKCIKKKCHRNIQLGEWARYQILCHHWWSPQNTDHADCRMHTLQTEHFSLILVFAFTFDSHMIGSGHKLVYKYISESCYVQAVLARYVTVDEISLTCNIMLCATCAFSTLAVQTVIPNGCRRVTMITPKRPSSQKT